MINPVADQIFLELVLAEIESARAKFPHPNPTLAALTEEVGELAQAMLHIREGNLGASWSYVMKEAVQVAVMAMRCATEGDGSLGVHPPPETQRAWINRAKVLAAQKGGAA